VKIGTSNLAHMFIITTAGIWMTNDRQRGAVGLT